MSKDNVIHRANTYDVDINLSRKPRDIEKFFQSLVSISLSCEIVL
jgi:hypothetical protein